VDSGGDRVFFFGSIGFRVDSVEDDFPVSCPVELAKHLFDSVSEVVDVHLDLRGEPFDRFGPVEIEADWVFDFSKESFRAFRKSETIFRCKIEP
jgi:hypothetical protein